jgi:hypothetical protein
MAQAIGRLDPVLEVKHDKIRLKTAGQSGEVVISRRSARVRAKTIDDLLFGSQFDAVAEVFHQPGRVLGDLTRSAGRTRTAGAVDPLDSVLAGASFAVQELHRHVRKLRCQSVGYGGDEAAVAAIILLIVVFAAMMIVGVAMMCGDDTIYIIGGFFDDSDHSLRRYMRDMHVPGDSRAGVDGGWNRALDLERRSRAVLRSMSQSCVVVSRAVQLRLDASIERADASAVDSFWERRPGMRSSPAALSRLATPWLVPAVLRCPIMSGGESNAWPDCWASRSLPSITVIRAAIRIRARLIANRSGTRSSPG